MTFEKRIRCYSDLTIGLVNLFLFVFILSGQLFGLLLGIIITSLFGVLPIAMEIHYLKKKGEKINWNNEILIMSDFLEIILGLSVFILCLLFYLETKLPLTLVVGIVVGGVFIANALIWMVIRIRNEISL